MSSVISSVLPVHNNHKRNERGKALVVGFPATSTSRSSAVLITCISNSWLLLCTYRTCCNQRLEGKKKERENNVGNEID